VNVETKSSQSSAWAHNHKTSRKSLNKGFTARKLKSAVFWDRKGVLMVEIMQHSTTIMSELYCKTLKKLYRIIKNKRCGMLTSSVLILHDVHSHAAAHAQALLEHFNWQLFYHDRLCGLVVRVLGYRSGGLGSIPGTTRKKSSGSGTGSTQPCVYN
jgi:hypothetical protein